MRNKLITSSLEAFNSTQAFESLEMLKDFKGKALKERLQRLFTDSPEIKEIFRAALEPSLVYGVREKTMPAIEEIGSGIFNSDTRELLMKLANSEISGQNAIDALTNEMTRLNPPSREVLRRIILKDLRCGVGRSLANDYGVGISEYPYCRCSLPKVVKLKKWNWAGGIISQEKANGMFFNSNLLPSGELFNVQFSSRQGSAFDETKFPQVVRDLSYMGASLGPSQIHGEMLVYRDGVLLERQEGNGILNSVLEGGDFAENERPVLHVWDVIPLDEVFPNNTYEEKYAQRLAKLARSIANKNAMLSDSSSVELIDTRIVHSIKEAVAHCAEIMRRGGEGTVVKLPEMFWKDGTSKEQVKLKIDAEAEAKIVGFVAGKGKCAATFGSIICRSADDQIEFAISGMSDTMREYIHKNRELILEESWVVSVIFNEISKARKRKEGDPEFSLFLPRFADLRNPADKTKANTLDEFKEAIETCIRNLESELLK